MCERSASSTERGGNWYSGSALRAGNYMGELGTHRMREHLEKMHGSLRTAPAEPGHSRAIMHRATERRCSLRSFYGEGDGGFREPARDAGRDTRRRATV